MRHAVTCDRTRVRRCVTVAVCGRLALYCGICTVTVQRWQPGTELSCLAREAAGGGGGGAEENSERHDPRPDPYFRAACATFQ